jgi:predicted ATPase
VAKRENPLVIFLDDFQWAGSPAFNLLQNIMLDDSIESLLIIGAYRDNEVNESHPLHFMINEINKVKPIKTIKLCPLEKTSIIQLVADTLHCTNKKALSLADILYKKAEGNPFFTTELLKNLHRERYIDFNYELGQWEWDITKIQSVDISDNVVEFMISRLQQLPDASRELLMKASCIGSQFDLNLLSHVVKRKPSSVAEDLHKPLRLGILMPMLSDYELAGFYEGKTNETNMKFHALYRFQHDRIQQAAYEMIPQKEKPSIHLLIGETLQESYHGKRMDGIIVSIADHMNKAISLITGETDKLKLAQLNLAAGIKAKASIAYRTAYELLKTGISLLGPENWNSHYQLSCDLYEQFSQSAFLCGEFSDAQNSNESLLQHVRTPLEKAKIYRLCALQFTINDKSEDALNASIKGLHLLGINVNKNSSSLSVLKQLLKTRFHQGFKSISSLADLPLMQDPKMIVCMQLLMEMTAPCYTLGHKNLFAEAILRQVGLAIRYGSTKEAPYAYATHGLLLNAIFNQPSSGFEFGKMAIKLNEKLGDISLRCRILFVYYSFIFPWNQPIHELYDIYEKLIMIGYQSGDLIYVTYTTHLCLMLPPKKSLGDTIKLGEKYIDMIRATKYGIGLIVLEVLQQFRLSLQDRKNHKFFEIDANSEVGFLTNIRATNYDALLTVYLVKKLSDCYIFSNYTHAYSILEEGEKSLEAMLSAVITEEFYLFATLTLAHCYPNANNHEKKKLLSQMSRYYKKIKSWSSRCEVNFLQHALLLEATIFRIKNKRKKAIAAYEKALAASQKNNFLHDEALICEEISHFYHDIIDSTKEHKYMHQAHYTYLKWGATAKVAQLQAAYPYLTPPVVKPSAAAAKLDDTITL